jgi:hypothetical protein
VEPDCCRNWTTLHISTALSEGIGPWLYKALQEHREVNLAAQFQEQLERSYAQSMISSLANQACFREVAAAFELEQIPLLALKGAYLGTFVYRNPALRPMNDLDMLVQEKHFEQARHLLDGLGFGISAEPLEGEYRILQPALAHVRLGTFPCAVDLHRAILCMDYYRLPSALVWQEAVKSELYGQPVYLLSNELNFIHLGMHTLTHLDLIRDWLDLALFLRHNVIDWDKLALLARSLGVMRPLYWVFRGLEQQWGVIAPEGFAGSLAAYVPTRIEDRVIRHRFRYLWRFVARLRLIPQLGLRLRYLRMRLFPTEPNADEKLWVLGWFRHLSSKIIYFLSFFRRR